MIILIQDQYFLGRANPIGNYTVRFSAIGIEGTAKQVALGSFQFNNGQDNVPPEIFNTVIDPDTVVVTDTNCYLHFSWMRWTQMVLVIFWKFIL